MKYDIRLTIYHNINDCEWIAYGSSFIPAACFSGYEVHFDVLGYISKLEYIWHDIVFNKTRLWFKLDFLCCGYPKEEQERIINEIELELKQLGWEIEY